MPRDTGGDYSLPAGNPVTSGTTIQSSWANTTLNDISVALSDSLDRDGRGGMRASFQFADGTVSDPGIQWSNDNSTGIYRAGLGDMRVTVSGLDLFRWNGTNVQIWASGQWNNVVYEGGTGGMPDGTATSQTLSWDGTDWIPTSNWLVDSAVGGGGNLTGSLFVSGDISLSANATVDGYDVSVLGAQNDNHIANLNIHFTDAPANGSQYARKDNGWEVVAATGEVIAPGTVDGQTVRWDTTTGAFLTDSALLVQDGGNTIVGGTATIVSTATISTSTWIDGSGIFFGGVSVTTHGFYSSASPDVNVKGRNIIFESDSAVEQARFDSSGRLGLGTIAPNVDSTIDVNGAIYVENRPLMTNKETVANVPKWIEVRDSLPGTPDPNTLYFLTT
jgi:hypothetical protein